MSWLGLENKVALVTGGASGIGKACCEAFAAQGATVVVGDLNEIAGHALVAELAKLGGKGHQFVKLNVTDRASVQAAVASIVQTAGHLDVLVNNAGINIPRLLVDPKGKEELDDAIWDKVTAINQKGVFLCAQAAARQMMSQPGKGVIVNMASESGLEGSEGQSVYAASKAALYSLTRSWAKELGKHGVRVVGLAPGILEVTGLRSDEYERALAYTRGITVEQLRASYAKVSIPLGRSGKLTEVADTVVYLASERSTYVHGTVLNVSGGKSRA